MTPRARVAAGRPRAGMGFTEEQLRACVKDGGTKFDKGSNYGLTDEDLRRAVLRGRLDVVCIPPACIAHRGEPPRIY